MNVIPGNSRIAIIGAGAIGGVVASVLARLGRDVTLCVRTPFQSLTVEIDGATHGDLPVKITNQPERAESADWVMIATKAQDTPTTVRWLDRLVGPKTVVAVLQNGIDHVERVQPLLQQGTVLPACVYTSAELVAPGHVRHHTGQRIIVPRGPVGAAFARLFEGGTMVVDEIDDFTTTTWRKLFGNVAVNPITALTQRRIGVMRDPEIREFARGILAEAVIVGRAAGADLQLDEIDQTLDFFAAYNPSGGSSMLYDRLANRPMEHEHLTGALVRAADRLQISVPLNRAVLALLRAIDEEIEA